MPKLVIRIIMYLYLEDVNMNGLEEEDMIQMEIQQITMSDMTMIMMKTDSTKSK
jgi:hypothetical protein